MSDPILPPDSWEPGTNQNSIPANDNRLRDWMLDGIFISESTDAQPGSPSDGDAYIMTGAASGAQWALFDQFDMAIFVSGTWYPYAPSLGIRVNIAGVLKQWNGSAYAALPSSDSTLGKQAIYLAAGAIRPSVAGGCAAVTGIASAANQPDIVSLDFDPTTQEYAQFAFVMPEKWDGGTISFIPHWSHAATTVNFGVVWDLQAVAVANDGTIATAFGTAQTSTDTGGTTNDIYSGPESSAITVAGSPAGGQMVFFRASRVTGNGSDTMAIDARLHGITLYVNTDSGTDA